MPELPEVITIRNDLRKEILGKKVINIKTNNYKLIPTKNAFEGFVLNHTFVQVENIAKLILIKMSSEKYIATHLNMSGLLLYNIADPHIKITLELNTGDQLHYSETRMFGYFEVWDKQKVSSYRNKYGKTPLDDYLTEDEFINKIKSKNTPIKTVLLNQALISGIGNIYANDALFMSGINPKKKALDLSSIKLAELFLNLKIILKEGIQHRGSTIDRYRDIYGKPGTHQNYFRVYGKKDKPCPICQHKLIYEKIQERPTFYCPNCQPESNQVKLI